MLKKMRVHAICALVTTLALLATNCSKPVAGEKELLGKIKGKASLRLADGSTISRDDSDEYSPYLIKLSDGYLVLVFGSNRDCAACDPSTHNIFMAKSLTAFDGEFIPFFNTPLVVQPAGAINAASQISFAAKASGTNVVLYVNNPNITTGTYDPANPTSGSLTAITNSGRQTDTIIGISGDGSKIYSTEQSTGTGYAFDPADGNSTPFGYGMDNATSATQVRQENSGYDDAILGVYYSSTYAAAGAQYFGPIIDLDTSLAFSGLSITSMSTFSADVAANDIVLFSAFDFFGGFTQDLYVITSHTSKDLWDSAGFPGFDFLPTNAPPTPDHHYGFESMIWSTCSVGTAIDFGVPGAWDGNCANVSFSAPSYDGFSDFGQFGASSYIDLLGNDVGSTFTIAAWIYIPNSQTCGSVCPIMSNGYLTAAPDGYRFYVNASTGELILDTALSSTTVAAISFPSVISTDSWYHVAVTVDTALNTATLYVNGVDVSDSTTTFSGFTTSATSLKIGRDGDNVSFTGDMDDVMIYSRVLDPSEISALAFSF